MIQKLGHSQCPTQCNLPGCTGTLLSSDEYIDGDYGDIVRFTPSHSAWIYVAMASVGMLGTEDPYIYVYEGEPRDGGVEVASDDDSGFDYNAPLDFWAEEGLTYYVFFTSNEGDEFGDYEWVICEEDALPAPVSAALASPDAATDTPAKP